MFKVRDHSRSGRRHLLSEAGILLMISLLLALASWSSRRPLLPLGADPIVYEFELPFPLISVQDALAAYETGTLFIDVRPVDLDASEHLPGALPVRLDSFADDLGAVLDFIYPEDALILYGDGDLQTLAAIAQRFKERGYLRLRLLEGGLPAWRAAGGELTGGPDD